MSQSPSYEVRLSSRASRDLDNLSNDDFRRVDERITTLSGNPRPHGAIKLRKRSYRLRVGPWRIIYLIDDAEQVVVVSAVRCREKDTYRRP